MPYIRTTIATRRHLPPSSRIGCNRIKIYKQINCLLYLRRLPGFVDRLRDAIMRYVIFGARLSVRGWVKRFTDFDGKLHPAKLSERSIDQANRIYATRPAGCAALRSSRPAKIQSTPSHTALASACARLRPDRSGSPSPDRCPCTRPEFRRSRPRPCGTPRPASVIRRRRG